MRLLKVIILSLIAMSSMSALACYSENDGVEICKGDRVIDHNNNEGTVVAVFSNGQIKIHLDYFATSFRSYEQLSKSAICFEEICEGDRVIDHNNNEGTVVSVFSNGQIKIQLDYFATSFRSHEQLSKPTICFEGICKGDRITDHHNNKGTVISVFLNGEIKIHLDEFGISFRSYDQLVLNN